MKRYPNVSIIIPLHVICERFFKDLEKFKILNYSNYEILVVCDTKVKIKTPKARLILTKMRQTGPAEKRDIALKQAKGEILAFIDDDAYPNSNWLKNAIPSFDDSKIAAVGGPGITPPDDGYWQRLTGLLYESIFCGGFFRHRFLPLDKRFVTDFPAYNLLVRKSVLLQIGGYGNNFYGGEDTFLCLKIIKAGYKILYDPKVVVYHHRRALFLPLLKQISNVGLHRGYFAKKFPQTSRQFGYFLPSIFSLVFFLLLAVSMFNNQIKVLFLTAFLLSLMLGWLSVIKKADFTSALLVSLGIISTHLVYGSFFIKGLLTSHLDR